MYFYHATLILFRESQLRLGLGKWGNVYVGVIYGAFGKAYMVDISLVDVSCQRVGLDNGLWCFDSFVVYEILDIMMKMHASFSLMTSVSVRGIVFANVMF